MNEVKVKVCPNCGGKLELDKNEEKAVCQYCGTEIDAGAVLNESDAVKIEKMKVKAQKDMELSKRREEAEKAKKQEEKDSINSFKKSKFSKVLIVFAVIGVFLCIGSFATGYILAGIAAVIMTALFLISYLMGLKVIREKKRGFRILAAILGFLMFIPYFVLYNAAENAGTPSVKIQWSEIELRDMLPEPKLKKGKIKSNTKEYLSVEFDGCSDKEYKAYVKACEDMGYTVDAEEETASYKAYNEKGYELYVYNYSDGELSIKLEAPMKMAEITWPSDLIGIVPVPQSSTGKVEQDSVDRFNVYIGKTSAEEYADYVSQCMNAGFTTDYNKQSEYFKALNQLGYEITVTYEGNSIMEIYLTKPKATTSPKEDEAQNPTEDEAAAAEESAVEETAEAPAAEGTTQQMSAPSGVTPAFKETMDSYEAFFDSYIAFMKKYENSDNALGMLTDYLKFLGEYSETMDKLNDIDTDSLSAADSVYYIEVTARITKKLTDAGQ